MKILFNPVLGNIPITYSFNGNVITAYNNGQTDTFDLTGYKDGQLGSVTTILPYNPLLNAYLDVNGELHVELLYFHSHDAPLAERFPTEVDVTQLSFGLEGS